MELVKEKYFLSDELLMNIDLKNWILHKNDGKRWDMLTTDSSKSFNDMLKSVGGYQCLH